MNKPFDNVPSTANIPETVDKRAITTLTVLTEKFEVAVSREEATAKNQEELAGVIFETFLDDDGSMKDIAHSAEIIFALRQTLSAMGRCYERIEAAQREMPTSIEALLCVEDRTFLDSNFIRLKILIKLNLNIVIGIGTLVGICIIGNIMMSNSASDKRLEYEQRIMELY